MKHDYKPGYRAEGYTFPEDIQASWVTRDYDAPTCSQKRNAWIAIICATVGFWAIVGGIVWAVWL